MTKMPMLIALLILDASYLYASDVSEKKDEELKSLACLFNNNHESFRGEEALEEFQLSFEKSNVNEIITKLSEKNPETSHIKKYTSLYNNSEIDHDNGVITLLEYKRDEHPLAVLAIEKMDDNNIPQILYSAFVFDKGQAIQTGTSIRGTIYDLKEEEVQQLKPANYLGELKSWKLDTYYINEVLNYLNRAASSNLYFIPESSSTNIPKINSTHSFTSASFAAHALENYCYIIGLNKEPFKSLLTVNSLIKISQSAFPSPSEKSAEIGGKSIATYFYSFIKKINFYKNY